MNDLKIYELLATLAIGTAISILLLYIYFISKKLFSIDTYKKELYISWLYRILKEDYRKSSHFFIILLLIFTFGLITQDLTDHLSDSEKSMIPYMTKLKEAGILQTEGELRLQALIAADPGCLTNLGNRIFSDTILRSKIDLQFVENPFPKTLNVSDFWRLEGAKILNDKISRKKLINYVNSIYYLSKNWCYLNSEPARKELVEIQLRIDLSRSFVVISILFFFIIILLFLLYYLIEFTKGRRKFKIQTSNDEGETLTEHKIYNPLIIVIIFAITLFLSQLCYSVAENNFNERAIGYYQSHFNYLKEK